MPMLVRFILLIVAMTLLPGCAAKVDPDPVATLRSPSLTGFQHRRAIAQLDQQAPNDPATLEVLRHMITASGYTIELREQAVNRLAERDFENLMVTLRRTVPRIESWGWLERICQIISERGWKELTPALVSSWARPWQYLKDDLARPEYLALVKLHGAPANVTELVFGLLVESRGAGQEGLRSRCWDLLHRLGQRERLIELLAGEEPAADDAMLQDLRAGAVELGLVPHNREEILWLRKLREPKRAEFWSRAVAVVQTLSPQRRAELAVRDLPILVSASLYEPELLDLSADDLYARVHELLGDRKHYVQSANYDGVAPSSRQLVSEFRGQLTWGDLAAILMACRALAVTQLVDHVFDYAERDKLDETTEYGGIIALDAKDRFELREFQPAIRRHDREFISSQAMLDAAYTSLFHFHLHAQDYRNDQYAGPGHGDSNYADNVRANCLVFTFMNRDTINVDYYRHDNVVVDLGEIKRLAPRNKNANALETR